MTIIVGAASPDGFVLGADSRTTWSDGQRHRISSDFAHKLFDVHGRFGVATYGAALIGGKTINGLLNEFKAQSLPGDEEGVEEFSRRLGEFFQSRYGDEEAARSGNGWTLGFLVAGYDQQGVGHLVEIGLPGLTIALTPIDTASGGTLWRGQTDVIGRLIKGVDGVALEARGVSLPAEVADQVRGLEYILVAPITLQDAADFASFLIRTTIDMQRFSDGTGAAPGLVPGCGGTIQLLAIKPDGVEWISRRQLVATSRPGWAEGSSL